jgi:hypothetical protein
MYVRVDSLGQHGLSASQMLEAAEMATLELGLAEGLQLVHGKDHGLRRYFETGGHIRFTSWGDPYVPVFGKAPPANSSRCRGPGGCFPHQACPYRGADCAGH